MPVGLALVVRVCQVRILPDLDELFGLDPVQRVYVLECPSGAIGQPRPPVVPAQRLAEPDAQIDALSDSPRPLARSPIAVVSAMSSGIVSWNRSKRS